MRANRWYPVDILNIDPGPGELVGKSSKVSFPQPVVIVSPVAHTVYSSITDAVDLQWIAGVGDRMRVLATVECTDGIVTSSYGVDVDEEVEAGMYLDGYMFSPTFGTEYILARISAWVPRLRCLT